MPEETQIDVCVVTYRRPFLLRRLLASLDNQVLPESLTMQIIVVDNDADGSANDVVSVFRKQSVHEVIYVIESMQGISYARNRAVDLVQGDYFAFLDDDEVVEEDWLATMYRTLHKYAADVVFGPVVGLLPDDAPEWAAKHPSFARPRKPTGCIVISGATNNVIVKTAALGSPPQQFDPAFALTGGGDTDFFYRLHMAGKKLVWCDEALAMEHVPRERLTTRWVYRRAYRGGQCFSRIFVSRYSWPKKLIWAAKKPLQILVGGMALPVARLHSHSTYINLMCRICAAVGQMTGMAGSRLLYHEYRQDRITGRARGASETSR